MWPVRRYGNVVLTFPMGPTRLTHNEQGVVIVPMLLKCLLKGQVAIALQRAHFLFRSVRETLKDREPSLFFRMGFHLVTS